MQSTGDKTQTEFHYQVPCDKSRQQNVIDSLKDSCKDKNLTDTCTHENEPDDSDSSSSSEEVTVKSTPAKATSKAEATTKPTQKDSATAATTKPTQKDSATAATTKPASKATTKSGKTLAPSKPAQIDCDNDHKVTVQDDKTVSGVLVVKSCHATRFARKPSRCSNVGDTFTSLLNDRLAKLGIKDKFSVKILQSTGDKTQTEFHYQVPCDKSRQQNVIDSLKDSCKDKTLTDTCTHENEPDDSDSSSSSEEVTVKSTAPKVTQKDSQATTIKATTKQGTQPKAGGATASHTSK